MKARQIEQVRTPAIAAEPGLVPAGQVCTTVLDDLIEAQLDRGQICTTVVDDLLDAQLAGGEA
jgi:hypothetical protein